MDNPYDTPILIIGLLSGVAAGLIPGRSAIRWINRLYIIALGASVSWYLRMHATDWAYSHPFNPNDGAALTMVALLGWLMALIWPILPTLFGVLAIRFLYGRIRRTNQA
jgi:hypothetical protein